MKATLRPDGSPSSVSACTFDIRLGDRLLCTVETPLLTTARVLLGEGIVLETRWPRPTKLALRGRVRRLARSRQLLGEIVGSQHHRSFSLDWPFEELTRCSLLNRFAQPHKLI
jgi:hypothetical protein